MSICPDCGHENIEGADFCEECQQPLSFLSKPRASSDVEYGVHKDRIHVLSPREPIVATPDTTVGEVLKLLAERKVGCVIIAEEGEVVGIFSERDALTRLNTRVDDLRDRPISEFMTPSPATLEMEDKIAFALHKMDLGGYRHIPILRDGDIVGVISVRDILRYFSEKILAGDTV